ncbi:hypothetical protein EWZ69_01380 [Helicobacter pylori]|uniref:hypothetical protein n=1 Tax=Helicobacter pylori TaxID=210 RepID=UPI0009A31381|nr:hypothetical protein [Helicobacter pylori]NHA84039.1 hypothetical protein [Helicobacter pylori]
MLAFKEYKEAKSQLPLFKISVNSNQPLSAQLKEYDKKKSALRAVLNTRSKRDNNLVHYDDYYGSKNEYHRFIYEPIMRADAKLSSSSYLWL